MSSLEEKRTQFRKYLERSGVVDALSKALIKLYEEPNKPDDAIRYVRKYMCEWCPDDTMYEMLKTEKEEASRTIVYLEQELERMRSKIKLTPDEVADLVNEGFQSLLEDDVCKSSLLKLNLNKDMCDSLSKVFTPMPVEANLYDCIKAGLQHHDHPIGAFAADAECFEVFRAILEPIILDYHAQQKNKKQKKLQKKIEFGDVNEFGTLDADCKYITSTRIRVSRNLVGFPFFPKLREQQYPEIEKKIQDVLETLEGEIAGVYVPLKSLDETAQADMYSRHIAFKRGGEYLTTAGCNRFWPSGRGVFHNPADTFVVWVNEQDHLKVISMALNGGLGDVYRRLVEGMRAIGDRLSFVQSERYGFLTSSPSDVGTGMRASVLIRLPNLSNNMTKLQTLADQLSLEVRVGGTGSSTEEGVLEVSNKYRLGYTEFEIVKILSDGVTELIKAEESEEA